MPSIKVTVLGCGDMAHSEQTTTAFLIEPMASSRAIMLFDCGYNVFPKLLKDYKDKIEFIEDVFISHLHADHVGSLGALIYYRFFMYGKKTRVLTHTNVMPHLDTLLKLMVPNVVNMEDINLRSYNQQCYSLARPAEAFSVDHMGVPACGMAYEIQLNQYVLFTGDADYLNYQHYLVRQARAIFHDCTFNTIPPGVHACVIDILKYPEEIKKKIILVHHGITENKAHVGLRIAHEDDVFEFLKER